MPPDHTDYNLRERTVSCVESSVAKAGTAIATAIIRAKQEVKIFLFRVFILVVLLFMKFCNLGWFQSGSSSPARW